MEQRRVSKDLTIEDRIRNRDSSNVLYGKHQQKNVKRLLAMKVKDATGKLINMFAVKDAGGSQTYCCRLCSKNNMDLLKLIAHAGSKKHKVKLQTADENQSSSNLRIGSKGEAASELQARLDKINDQVMIGVEYIIEVCFGGTFEPIFHCVLCEGKFDLQVVVQHLTSYMHRLNYLEKHFPTAFKQVRAMEKREQKHNFLEKICQDIEDQYGRLSVKLVRSDKFSTSQAVCYDSVSKAKHIDEKMGRTFVDINQNNELSPVSEFDELTNSTCGLEQISTSSESEMSPYKASGKVLASPRMPFHRSQKVNLSPISPEKAQEFDKRFRSGKSLSTLSRHGPSISRKPYEAKRHFNDAPVMKKVHYDVETSNSRSSASYGRKESKFKDKKYSMRIVEKSPERKRKCTRKKDRNAHVAVSQHRDRSRSPQGHRRKDYKSHGGVSQNRERSVLPRGHQFFIGDYRQSCVDYRNIRTYGYFEAQQNSSLSSGPSEYALFRPSHEIVNRTDYLLSCNGRYNQPNINIPTAIEWRANGGEYALTRPSLERTNRADYSLSYHAGYGYKCPTGNIPTSIDYALSRPHRNTTNRTDYLLSYNGGLCSKDYRPMPTSIEADIDDGEPITIISVLSLLSAFEDFLGSLGPKMVELMTEAIAMENISVNFSNRILDDINHCILFETTKEKLKGLLSAGIVESNKITAVKRAIRHMNVLIYEANERKRLGITKSRISNHRIDATEVLPSQVESHDRSAVADKILVAVNEQGRGNISKVELAQYVDRYVSLANAKGDDDHGGVEYAMDKVMGKSYQECNDTDSMTASSQAKDVCETMGPTTVANANSSALQELSSTTLSDSNLTTLIKNFSVLSDTEKQDVITNIRDIEAHEPDRMQRLISHVEIGKLLNLKSESKESLDEMPI